MVLPGDDVLSRIDPRLCVACKAARGLCGIDPCPLLQRVSHHLPKVQLRSRDLWGSSPPSLFVGRHGYPKVGVGPMLPPERHDEKRARRLDNPRDWLDLSIPDVVGLRSSLVRTVHAVRVDQAARDPDRITRLTQELAVAARPVDTEVRLDRIPHFTAAHVGEFTAPHGPVATVESARLADNVRVERRVEAVTSDTDLRAGPGMVELYRNGTDPYQLERILSAGMLGTQRQRRLVPTRWSITATDDILGKDLIQRALDFLLLDRPTVHSGELFGNRFHILLAPRVWGYDLVEVWAKGAFWVAGRDRELVAANDWEDHRGRSRYAASTAGGYYAARRSVLEHLAKLRRQATAIVLREITDAYTTPLGVWVVREASRRALEGKGLVFDDLDAALRHMDRRSLHPGWRSEAGLLPQILRQRTLQDFGRAG